MRDPVKAVMFVITESSSGVPTKDATGLPFAAFIKQLLICTKVKEKILLMVLLAGSGSAASVSLIAIAALEPLLKPKTNADIRMVCTGPNEPKIFRKIAKTTNNNIIGVF